jgi:flavin-binding protein dodecin
MKIRVNQKFAALMVVASAVFFASCDNKKADESDIEQAALIGTSRDSLENALITTLDEINQNLDNIRNKQGLVAHSNGSESISKKQEILTNIQTINLLLEENQVKLADLEVQAKTLGNEKSVMARIAKQTKDRIHKQEDEINNLKELLAQEFYKVEDLSRRLSLNEASNDSLIRKRETLEQHNSKLDLELNRAWFIYGTHRELKAKELLESEGGIIGLGKKDVLSNTFYKHRSAFTEVDVRETLNIPILGKKPKLITFHPKTSYELLDLKDTEYSNIKIINAEEFWSASKYLMVEVQ